MFSTWLRSKELWQSKQRLANGVRAQALDLDRRLTVLAATVGAVVDSQEGGVDQAQLLQVAVDLGQVDVHHQVGERVVLEVAHLVGDHRVLLLVALHERVTDLVAQLTGAIPEGVAQFFGLAGVEGRAHRGLHACGEK